MADADWDLGQKLIEQGVCSLDQVREVLSFQDRMRKMGAVSKPFARVLLEKGFARRDQLLQAGVPESDLPPLIDAPLKAPAPMPAAATGPSVKPLVWTAVVLTVVGAIVLGIQAWVESSRRADDVAISNESAAAQAQLDEIAAEAAAVSDFANAEDIVARYEALTRANTGTQWEIEAHRRLKEYKDRMQDYAKAELEDLEKEDPPLREQQRWADLLALYRRFPARFLKTTDVGGIVRGKMQELSQKVFAIYSRDKAEVEKFADAKQYADALARVRAMEATAPADRADELLGLRARIERESRGAAEKSRQEVADAYFKIDSAFKEAMLRRDGFRAAVAVREFLVAPWKDEQRPFVRVRGVDYDALLKAFEPFDGERIVSICEAAIPELDSPGRLGTGEGALLALRNAVLMWTFNRDQMAQFHAAASSKEPLHLPGLGKGHFEKREGKTVFVALTGEVLEAETSPLTEPDLAALAMMVGPANAAMEARVGFFYFYSAPGLQKEAYTHLARAVTLGARGVKLYLGGLAVAAESELKRELETKFGAAQDLFKNSKWPQAKKLLGDVLEFPEHPYTKSVRAEIEKMLYEIAEGGPKEKGLAVKYKAKVESLDSSTLRMVYDFESKDQLDAFESVPEEGGRRFKGRWRIDRGVLESSADASVLRWKPVVQGDVTLEYDLTPVDEAQNIVVDLYYNKGEANHYAVVTGFDWVGKTDGDRDNSAEDRFGMPRTCVIKYPVTVDKARWESAETWDAWRTRLAGKAAGAWKPVKGRTSKIRIERHGAGLRVLADRTLVWEGEDYEYSRGQLLFYSDSRTRIDNLVITFKPQP